jgi:hypothetical protein
MATHPNPAIADIPQSRGMPIVVQVFFAVGLVIIFFMGGISAFNSKEFHQWPAVDSAKVPLSGSFP